MKRRASPERTPTDTGIESIAHGKERIVLGNVFLHLPKVIKECVPKAARHVLVVDVNVYLIYGEKLVKALKDAGLTPLVKIIPGGEASKNRELKAEIEDWMLTNACNRDTCIIAFGGGVVGDLTGYVAATYLRGVDFIQVPTTLLAMVDSSIGGKTGIDAPVGKNLIGAFHHPKAVFIDPTFLFTLPKREFVNGMAEIIKTAAIRDVALFEFLERNIESILSREESALRKIIMTCATIKAEVVALDDKEAGIRCILNFGHTIGHAIEALVFPELLHGECVSIGMVLELELANIIGHLKSSSTIGRVSRLCQIYGLPVALPKDLAPVDILTKMGLDKKNAGKKIRCVILKSIGDVFHEPIVVETNQILRLLVKFITVKPHGPVNGEITVPGSKSISNRVLLMCALAKGNCKVSGLLHADDTDVMLDSLHKLGVQLEWQQDGKVLSVNGCNGKFKIPLKPLFLGNAGTASRFLTTMVNLVHGVVTMTGSERLGERPMEDLVVALQENSCQFKFLKNPGCIPFEVHGSGFPGGKINISAKVSSQFVSSVLISAPYANNQVELVTQGEVVSQPFIDMTVCLMEQFGVLIKKNGNSTIVPLGGYVNPAEFTIESDASSASYPLAMAAITGGKVTVKNVGSKSIQSDSKFYTVLEMMGCQVKQTETDTTVQGPPDGLLKAVEVDMSSLTDCFMTIVAIAAVAEGTTKITNIANQRVKECNRIAAMVKELGKCGVNASELPDGIQVEGVGRNVSRIHGASIDCYKDHRIAMSFAVLGLRVPGIIITDKECVNKTYPEFWEHCEKIFGISLEIPMELVVSGTELNSEKAAKMDLIKDEHESVDGKSVIIIGARGIGKTMNGKALAKGLNWKFFDLDHVFEEHEGCTILDFIQKGNEWSAFRQKEVQFLKKIVSENPKNAVISCGGGIVITPEAHTFLCLYSGPVLHLRRDIEDIVEYLAEDKSRPSLSADPRELWKQRASLYDSACQYDFHILRKDKNWSKIEQLLIAYTKKIVLKKKAQLPAESFFLSLTCPNLESYIPVLPQLVENAHALELRVDLLENYSHNFILEHIWLLRNHTSLPIIYTVRSKDQGGKFSGNESEMINLLEVGLKANCEFIDVEACWSLDGISKITKKKENSQIIASQHAFNQPVTAENLQKLFDSCLAVKDADVIKVVGFAKEVEDVFTLRQVVSRLSTKLPVIALLAGDKGRLSRVVNKFMTPVTHPLLPNAAAPGQLSVRQILKLREMLG